MTSIDDFIDECLREHNQKRVLHGAPALKHSRALDKTAQDWAEQLITEQNVKNSPLSSRGELGESISMRTSTNEHVDIQGAEVVSQWYSDIKNYNFDSGKGSAGNFTQLVWNSTREVGFAKSRAPGKCIVVAHYRPPGNVRSRYLDNVFKPGSADATSAASQPTSVKSAMSNDSGEHVTKKTVVTETVTDPDGNQCTVRREVVETTDQEGHVRRRVSETFVDNTGQQDGAATTRSDIDSISEDAELERKLMSMSDAATRTRFRELHEFTKGIINAHNVYRQCHAAPVLKHDQHLSEMAQQWADYLLNESCLSNSGLTYEGMRLGENIASRWSNTPLYFTSQEVVDNWYQEIKKHKFGHEPESIQGIGNFTQLVWAGSRFIGVGKATRPIGPAGDGSYNSTKTIVVCFYHPPGNVHGQFCLNVHPAITSSIAPTQATCATQQVVA